MKKRDSLTKNQLWELREEIVLNSLFISDYKNTFGFTPESVCEFFFGYVDYIDEIAQEQTDDENELFELSIELDNPDNLYAWYRCFDSDPFDEKKGEK